MIQPYEIVIYQTATGKEPYTEWEESLDKSTMARIDARLTRIRETGSIGKCEPVGDGVYELKFDFGSEKETSMILLLGGSEKLQQRDINKSKEYWKDHLLIKRGKNEKI